MGLLALAVTLLLAVGCGGGAAGGLVDATAEVDAYDNSFRPGPLTVEAGTTVVWENRGRSYHDVVPTDGGGWGVTADTFGHGATYEHRFTEPGTYAYHCSLHGTPTKGMVGTIIVT
jgi:plastocyanin